jgi:hypothetical protein
VQSPDLALTTLAAEAHLMYVCIHAVLHHRDDELYLLRFWDIHRIVTYCTVNWSVVVQKAAEFRWTYACERALQLAVDFFGTPIPDQVFAGLRSKRAPDEDIRQIMRESGAGRRFEWVVGMLRDVPLREKVRLLRTVLFPTPAYMRERYRIPTDRAVFPYYLWRWTEQAADTLAAVWKRIRHAAATRR